MENSLCFLVVFISLKFIFRPAKVDECDYCTEADQKIQGAECPSFKSDLQALLKIHQEEAAKQVENLSSHERSCPIDDENAEDDWLTIATDLQQTHPVPKMNNQSAFYKTKVRIRFIFF